MGHAAMDEDAVAGPCADGLRAELEVGTSFEQDEQLIGLAMEVAGRTRMGRGHIELEELEPPIAVMAVGE
jgi:hypothetical protein